MGGLDSELLEPPRVGHYGWKSCGLWILPQCQATRVGGTGDPSAVWITGKKAAGASLSKQLNRLYTRFFVLAPVCSLGSETGVIAHTTYDV